MNRALRIASAVLTLGLCVASYEFIVTFTRAVVGPAPSGYPFDAATKLVLDAVHSPFSAGGAILLAGPVVWALAMLTERRQQTRTAVTLFLVAPLLPVITVATTISALYTPIKEWVPAPPKPGPARVNIYGRVFESDGAPSVGATVALFADRDTWTESYFMQGDEDRDCIHFPIACPKTPSARSEVWRQLILKAVLFPQRIATGTTDARGAFSLRAPNDDVVVAAWKGDRFTLERPRDFATTDRVLELPPAGEPSGGFVDDRAIVAVTTINPFTRKVTRTVLDGGATYPASSFDWIGLEFAPDSGWDTNVTVTLDGQPADATLEVDCGPDSFVVVQTQNGRANFKRGAKQCPVKARSASGWANTYFLETMKESPIRLNPALAATVRWRPAIRPTRVEIDFAPTGGLGAIGMRGGGTTPGVGLFDGGVAVFSPLWIRSPAELIARVEQPGFVTGVARFDAGTLTELEFDLIPATGTIGRVVDSNGRGVPYAQLEFQSLDGGYEGFAPVGPDGEFGFSSRTNEPLVITAHHLVAGQGSARTDQYGGLLELRRPTGPVTTALLFEEPDGGVLRNGRVTIWDLSMTTDDAGVVRFSGLEPGVHDYKIDDAVGDVISLDAGSAGTFEARVRLRR